MKLISAHVQKFRNFEDSEAVAVETDVTTLVGKNESGKTAFLQALHRLNPHDGSELSQLDDYPRWLYTKDRRAGVVDTTPAVTADFTLEENDYLALAEQFGADVVAAKRVTITRRYNGTYTVDQDETPNEQKAVEHVVHGAELPKTLLDQVHGASTFEALAKGLDELEFPPAEEGDHAALTAAVERVRAGIVAVSGEKGDFHGRLRRAVRDLMPKFFYFSDYSFIDGRTDLRRVYGTSEGDLDPGERTALALLRLAGADNETLLDEDYESRTAELEAVSNELTAEMAEYWSQSRDLAVVIDVDKKTEVLPHGGGQKAVARHLEVRVRDRRHGHTDNIDKRSNGFRWFFSFLAAFTEYEGRDDRVIILLDEPALTLHARAQKDFLRFIEERLAPHHQVVFTTHSPFMVEPTHLERARLVEDKGEKIGSKVSADVLATDRDTLFPLQAALGYDLAQSMFIAPHNLLIRAPPTTSTCTPSATTCTGSTARVSTAAGLSSQCGASRRCRRFSLCSVNTST